MKSGGWSSPRYQSARERAWHLSILMAHEAIAWCTHAMDTGEPTALQWSADASALDSEALPQAPASVSFVTLPEWSTLVPEAALEPGTEAAHLRLVHGGLPTGALRNEPFDSLGAVCIYVHDDERERMVLDRFPGAQPVPMQALMLRGALALAGEGPALLLHRSHDRLDAAVADQGRVLLTNTYPAKSSQDALYYALLAAEGCGLRPGDLMLHHGGTHLTAHERDLLKRYFPRERDAAARWPALQGAGLDPFRWSALLEQFACAS